MINSQLLDTKVSCVPFSVSELVIQIFLRLCNCNAIDVVALSIGTIKLYFMLYSREIKFAVRIYIFCLSFFSVVRREIRQMQSQVKEDKFSDSQIFHTDDSSRSRQYMLPAFGLSLSFFHRTSFTK